MKFPYQKLPGDPSEAFPKTKYIPRPVIPIHIINDDKRVGYHVLIDSGADYCIFHASIGEVIGLKIRNDKKMFFWGTGGVKQTAYFHHVHIEVGGYRHPCYAGFSYDFEKMPYGVLGQNEFFDVFTVLFDKVKGRVEIRQRKS